MPAPVAYLRRSSSSTLNGNGRISYAVQESSVRELATRHGDEEPRIIVEWGVSGAAAEGAFGGTGRGGRRVAYHALKAAIEGGEVSALYAYSLSRLGRSTRDLLDLAEACARAGVPVRLAKEGDLDFTTPYGRMYLTILAAVATAEAEIAAERGKDRTAAARERGAYIGRPPFGWRHGPDGQLLRYEPEAEIDELVRKTYASTLNYKATAKTLNGMGVLSPSGGRWGDGTVRRIVVRAGQPVGVYPPRDRTRQGSRAIHAAAFVRLLVCSECGSYLTTNRRRYRTADGEWHRWTGYVCQGAKKLPEHSRPIQVSEAAVMRWAQGEVALLRVPYDELERRETAGREREDLDARRERVLDMIEAGTITRTEAEPRLVRIAHDLAAVETRVMIQDIPEVHWDWPAAKLGPVLAAIFESVTVDIAAATFAATWAVPEWRAS